MCIPYSSGTYISCTVVLYGRTRVELGRHGTIGPLDARSKCAPVGRRDPVGVFLDSLDHLGFTYEYSDKVDCLH